MKPETTEMNGPTEMRRWSRHACNVGKARADLRKVLAGWQMATLEDTALVVLSELLTNAIRHARTSPGREIETRYLRQADGVRIEVHDAADELPTPRVPGPDGGWGLGLVEALAASWGADERDGAGKSVWAVVTASGRNGV